MIKSWMGVVAACVVTGTSIAQQLQPPRAVAGGDVLFDTASYRRLTSGDVTWSAALTVNAPVGIRGAKSVWDVYGSMGYFLSDRLELEIALTYASAGGVSGTSILGGVNWYFIELFDDMYPYIGASLSHWFGDVDAGTHLQVKAGMRQYFSAHSGIRYWAQYDTKLDSFFDREGTASVFIGFFTLAH